MKKRVAAVAVGLLMTLATPAFAATELAVSDVRVDAGVRTMDLRLSAQGLTPGTGLDPASVVATVDGRPLPAASITAAAQTEQVQPPRVLLVVDTTGSMAGQPMAEAKQAISAFVATAPVEVPLGLMAFSSTPRMLVPPTLDRSPVLGAVAGLQAEGQTSLYDAVRAGVAALGRDGDRRIVLLSDGEDNRSGGTLADALKATADSGVRLDAIGFRTEQSVDAVLRQLAASGHGHVLTAASSAELTTALASTVRRHASALDVRLLVPEDLRGSQTLTVSAATSEGRFTATSPVTLGKVTVAAPAPTGWLSGRNALLAGLAAIAGSLLLGSLVLLGGGTRDRRRTHDVLERFTTSPAPAKEDVRTASPVARTALDIADKVATKRNLKDRSAARLARAAVTWTPAEWLLLQAGIAFGLTLLLVLLGWNLLIAVGVGSVVGVVVPNSYLRLRARRRQHAFADKLPDALQMTASSLSAGYSLAQALDGLVREGSEPMATEIGKALAESRLGVPVETTLEGVAERMDSKDFSWVVMAIRVQREVGGNLAGVLGTVSTTMRERAMLRRHVRGLSAEGRLSAYILLALPVGIGLYMFTMRREYLEPMYTTGLGIVLIAAAVVLMAVGSFVMSRMVKVEI